MSASEVLRLVLGMAVGFGLGALANRLRPTATRWFGWLRVTHVRTAFGVMFTVSVSEAINLSTSDNSHHASTYAVWYALAVVALVGVVATTVLIERARSSSRAVRTSPGRRRAGGPPRRISTPATFGSGGSALAHRLVELYSEGLNLVRTVGTVMSTGASVEDWEARVTTTLMAAGRTDLCHRFEAPLPISLAVVLAGEDRRRLEIRLGRLREICRSLGATL